MADHKDLKAGLEQQKPASPSGQPIDILVAEHKVILKNLEELGQIASRVGSAQSLDEIKGDLARLKDISRLLLDTESHHQREEQAIFPRLESLGIDGPPRVMRLEHEELRAKKRALARLVAEANSMDFAKWANEVNEVSQYIAENLGGHIDKEDNVLYPMALRALEPGEWKTVKQEFDRIGYCPFTPKAA